MCCEREHALILVMTASYYNFKICYFPTVDAKTFLYSTFPQLWKRLNTEKDV